MTGSGPDAGPQIKGQLLIARFEHLRETYDPGAITAVVDALGPEEAERLRALNREEWYPFATLLRLDHAIARVLAGGDPTVFEQLGRASARHRSEWLREHAALVSVHAFLSRVAERHRQFHSFGLAAYKREGFHAGELTFWDYPHVDPAFCLSSRGYFLGVIDLLTGRPGSVEETLCQCRGEPACVFRLHWPRTENGSAPPAKP